jgi:hypothetical protein
MQYAAIIGAKLEMTECEAVYCPLIKADGNITVSTAITKQGGLRVDCSLITPGNYLNGWVWVILTSVNCLWWPCGCEKIYPSLPNH